MKFKWVHANGIGTGDGGSSSVYLLLSLVNKETAWPDRSERR